MKHEPCSKQIALRVAPTLRDEIEQAASDEGQSLAGPADRCDVRFWHKADIPAH
jgi:predicted HicB family RNase H-like nuclease